MLILRKVDREQGEPFGEPLRIKENDISSRCSDVPVENNNVQPQISVAGGKRRKQSILTRQRGGSPIDSPRPRPRIKKKAWKY